MQRLCLASTNLYSSLRWEKQLKLRSSRTPYASTNRTAVFPVNIGYLLFVTTAHSVQTQDQLTAVGVISPVYMNSRFFLMFPNVHHSLKLERCRQGVRDHCGHNVAEERADLEALTGQNCENQGGSCAEHGHAIGPCGRMLPEVNRE